MILFREDYLCDCNEEFSLVKLRAELEKSIVKDALSQQEATNSNENPCQFDSGDLPSEGRQIFTRWHSSYPNKIQLRSKTVSIRYEKPLSTVEKIILNNFQKKYLYHAIDDILSTFKSKPRERDNLLAVLYSPVIYLQNNFSIDFFDIWIDEIFIQQLSKGNKFLTNGDSNLEPFRYITIKLVYHKKLAAKKTESFW